LFMVKSFCYWASFVLDCEVAGFIGLVFTFCIRSL